MPTPLEKTEALLEKAIADLESIRAKKADILEKEKQGIARVSSLENTRILDNKITELKKMKAEQKHLNPIHIFRHKELTEHIDKTEKEIKKLQNLKSAFLDKMSCKSEKDIPQYKALHIKNDDIIIEIAANNTELEKQCADDKAEFISIKKSIPSEDMVAVQAERYTIHDEYTKSNIQKLQEKYGRKYSYDIYKDVEADVNMELHEKPFSILMRLEKNKQRNTDHNHTKYRNHEQER